MSSPHASIVHTRGDNTTPDADLAVPHVLLDQSPAPNPKPVKPSDGPLLTKYLSTTAPPPVCDPEEAVPEIKTLMEKDDEV